MADPSNAVNFTFGDALAQGAGSYQKGLLQSLLAQSTIAKDKAAIDASGAAAALNRAKADAEAAKTQAAATARSLQQDPDALARNVAMRMPEAPFDGLRSLGKRALGGPFEVDPRLTPDQLRLAGETMGALNALSFADKGSSGGDIAKIYDGSGRLAMLQRAPDVAQTDPNRGAWLTGAASGHAPELYKPLDSGRGLYGVYDGITKWDPHLYASQLSMEGALANQRNAAAGASNASATQHLASAAKTRAEIPFVGQKGGTAGGTDKPLPGPALKLQQQDLDAISTAAGITKDLGAISSMITDGTLQLGPARNLYGTFLNWTGHSDANSRNLQTAQATIQRIVNDSLLLAKGTQTEGDAKRAAAAVLQNLNDPKVVQQRLNDLAEVNARTIQARKASVNALRQNYGLPDFDFTGFTNLPPAVGGGTSPRSAGAPSDPGRKTATQADIAATMKASGRSRADVLNALKANGYEVIE